MTMYLKHLTYDERAVWGRCPICYAENGQPCKPVCPDVPCAICGYPAGGPCLQQEQPGTHIARLVNAPLVAAVPDGQSR